MVSKERVKLTMGGMQPDRVPVMCQPSWGHILLNSKIDPVELWHEPQAYAEGLLWIQRNYHFDGILMSVNGFDPEWKSQVRNVETHDDGSKTITWKDGTVFRYPIDELPGPSHVSHNIKDFSTFDPTTVSTEIPTYLPVSQGLRFNISLQVNERNYLIKLLTEKTKNEVSLHGEVYSPFDYFIELFGLEQALMNLLFDGGKSREIIARFTEGNIKYALEMVKAGCDAIKVSSPYAGQEFINRDMYLEFVQPFESRIAKAVRKTGMAVYVHTCGAIDDRLELMCDAGFSGIECLDPPPLGNVMLDDAVARIGDSMFIKGNIDSVNTLLIKDKQVCKRDAIERIRMGTKACGYILSTACSIAPHVRPENIVVLSEAAMEEGQY